MEMTHLRTLLLLTCGVSGLGPSSAQSGGQQVQGIMGESVTFPVPVYNRGFLYYNDLGAVAGVWKGTGDTELKDKFRDRLQWDKQTGLFTITELKLQDEGQYKVDDSDGQKITTFQLTVYRRVSKPTVDTQICSVLCSVENDRDVTLSWTRGKEILNQTREKEILIQTSSPHLNTTLSLRLDIERHPETYYCEVKNPVSSERLRVDSEEHCAPTKTTQVNLRYIPVIPSAALLVFPGVFLFYFIKQKPGDGTQVLCFTCSSLLISVHACW
ncbi:SLAM family member 5-like isoform X1 [Scleropages formosus]|uniref:SLAM family member 5-like isoform X1 n=1 Tax=Scleropages formosus TaxID=113540 RepID=UPI0010FA77A4|nr:SLAM family member 5-like isoform X1 [Scleropages formosus]XP_029114871.1 SLAM family member 5-like isoform X1 [Scleropages formosus]XP_029114872.1 SLAM family member 5-like isoform X1 [Scleropages formosus]